MIKILVTVFVLFLFSSTISIAEESHKYKSGIGVRGGFSSGITFKHFLTNENAFEIIGSTHRRGILLTGLYQWYAPAFDVKGLNWYYGFGAHVGFYDEHKKHWVYNYMIVGANGVFGIDYKIENIPINVSVDILPRIDLLGNFGLRMGAGLSVRYVLQ